MAIDSVEIRNLESKIKMKTYLKNEVVIPTDGETVVYVGEAIGLYFPTNGNIRGKARLSRYDRREGKAIEKKLVRLVPLTFQTREFPVAKDNRIWTFETSNYTYFLHDGNHSDVYRDGIKEQAAHHELKLSDELFNKVFGPIDSEIMKMNQELSHIM